MSDESDRRRRRSGRPWEGEISSVEKVWVEGEDDPAEGRLPLDGLPPDVGDPSPSEYVDESGYEISAPGEALSAPIPAPQTPVASDRPPAEDAPSMVTAPAGPPAASADSADPGADDADRADTDDADTDDAGEDAEVAVPEGELVAAQTSGLEQPDDRSADPATVPDPGLYVEDLKSGPTSLDDFTQEDYIAASTQEYRDFAEELARAETDDVERQAVAASIPGVGSGLIGFEDVTGQRSVTEEEIEHEEQQAASDLTVRIGTGLVLVGVFLGGLMLGRGWFTGVVCAVMVLSLGEFYSTVRSRGFAPVALFGFIGVLAAGIGTLRGGVHAIGSSVVLTVALTGLLYGITLRRNPLENAAITVLGMAWVSMLAFAVGITRAEEFVGLILLLVLLTAFNDIGAYFVGRSFGRRQLAPTVSPGKTIEGFVGGTVVVFVLAAILSTFPAVFHVNLREALLLAAVVAIMGPLGDAAESVVKRALDVKDMGSLLPGHGGMLDRIDALLFVLPPAYLLLDLFGKL